MDLGKTSEQGMDGQYHEGQTVLIAHGAAYIKSDVSIPAWSLTRKHTLRRSSYYKHSGKVERCLKPRNVAVCDSGRGIHFGEIDGNVILHEC